MKKYLFLSVAILLSVVVLAQETKNISPISFAGGVIVSANNSNPFVGFVGPKLSMTFRVSEKYKAEVALNAFPGLILKPELKPGLALGSTLTLKKNNWKIKPVVGIVLLKTNDWQPMLGLGFVF